MGRHAAAVSAAAPWVELRPPTVSDGASIRRLVTESPPLEPNSAYAYLLLCRDFADTCIVAEADGRLAGFVCGYRKPAAPDTLFVWQVAVNPADRGRRLGLAMLVGLLARQDAGGARFLEATVTPSNGASQRLFRGLARELATECSTAPAFAAHHFGGERHEEEVLFRVGPIQPMRLAVLGNELLRRRSDYRDLDCAD